MEWQFKVVSGDFCPRQFEFRRDSEDIIFGTVSGDVCYINSVDDWKIKKLGNFGVSIGDTILGLCWFKNDSQKFISGSSEGKVYCGEVRDYSDADTDCRVFEFPNFERLTSVHLNSSNDKLLVSGYSHDAIVYDVSTTQVVQEFKNIHGNFINISRFSNLSPNVFSTSSFDKTVKTWDMRMRNSTSDTELVPAQLPIYEVKCDTGVVMINFSKDDMFLLASCVDNEINQYHFLDGAKHMSFKIPRIESVNNYTRAYYTTSGNHIVTGSCEEKNVKILSTETGEVLSAVEIYDGRKDDSIYVQSLRCSPNDEYTICVLTNYKDLHHRELVIARPIPRDLLQRDSSAMDIAVSKKVRDTSRKADLFAAMNYGFYSPGFAQDLSNLRQELREVSAVLEHLPLNDGDEDRIVRMLQARWESHGVQRSEQFFRSQVVLLYHHEFSVCAVEALLSSPAAAALSNAFQEMCLLKDREPAFSPRQEITAIHRFILKARCSLLHDRVKGSMHGLRSALLAVEISDLVSSSLLPLLPTVVDFIYSGSSAIDEFIIRFHILSELLRCCEELDIHCSLLFQEILPVQLFRVISSDIDRTAGQVRSEILVSLCKDEEIWRYPFLSSQLAATLWDLDDLAGRLQLLELQAQAEQLIRASISISNACQSFLIAKRRGKAELQRIIDKFVTNHWKIMCVSSRNLLDESGMNEMEAVVQTNSKQYSAEVLSREGIRARQEWIESVRFHRGMPTSGSDSPVLSIRDEFPFLAGKGVISDSTSLPVYVGHSAVRVFDDQIMFIGGASADRYHPQSKILLYDIPSNQFKYVYCGGNGMSASAGVHPSISLQKIAAHKIITAVGKSSSEDKPLRYSSLPNSSVYRQRQEHPLWHGCDANDPLSTRFSALDDLSTPTSDRQMTNNEPDGSNLETQRFGKESTIMKGPNKVSAFPSPGSEYFVNEIFYELDCRSLTWTDPSISVREAFCDVGGSIIHPLAAAAATAGSRHLLNRGTHLGQGKRALIAAAKRRLSHSFIPLYDVDVPYRCHVCLFTDNHEDVCSCISRHSASSSSINSPPQQVKSTWVIQFGGYCGVHDGIVDDLHILSYQESAGKESQSSKSPLPLTCIDDTYYKWFKVRASGIPPSVRFGHSAVILPSSNHSLDPDGSNLVLESHTRMIVFGGAGLQDEHCDIGSLRVERHPMARGPRGSLRPVDLHWEKVVVTGKAPSKRHNHSMITLPESGIMVMFGGMCSGESSHVYDDVWCLIPEDLYWYHAISDAAQIPVPVPAPIPLGFQTLHGLGREFLAAATASTRASAPPGTLLYGPRFRWEEVSTIGVPPSCRCRHTCTYIGKGVAFIFGGMDESSSDPDVPKLKDSLIYGLHLVTPALKGDKDAVRGEWLTTKLSSSFVRFPGEPAVRQLLCSLAVDLVSLIPDEIEAHIPDDLYDLTFSVEDPSGLISEGDRMLPMTFFTPSSLIRSRCAWANAVLSSNMSESRSNNIQLPASPAAFRTFLRYLCSDCICDSSSNEVCALIELGAQYDLPRLVCLCEGWLLSELRTADQSTVRELLEFSSWLHLDVLRAACWAKLLRDGDGDECDSTCPGEATGHERSSYEDMWDWARNHAHAYMIK